jgi:ABC-type nitrate/sulfonate/bicarbonate transport system permease component
MAAFPAQIGVRRQGKARARARRHGLRRALPPLLFAIVVLGLWQLYCELSGVRDSTLPKPSGVASSLWDDRSLLLGNAWVTLKEILLGYLAAIGVGVGVGVLVCSSRVVERMVCPWLVISQMIPIPAIAPIIVIWTGFDIRPKIIVIALVSFFPLAVNTIDGLKATEPELLNLLRTLGANRIKQFRVAQLPAAMPFIFAGLKIAAALSVIGAVFAEWVGASSGLGYLILTLNNQTATTEMFATIVVLAAIGIGLFALMGLLERVALPWYHDARRDSGLEAEGVTP